MRNRKKEQFIVDPDQGRREGQGGGDLPADDLDHHRFDSELGDDLLQ